MLGSSAAARIATPKNAKVKATGLKSKRTSERRTAPKELVPARGRPKTGNCIRFAYGALQRCDLPEIFGCWGSDTNSSHYGRRRLCGKLEGGLKVGVGRNPQRHRRHDRVAGARRVVDLHPRGGDH